MPVTVSILSRPSWNENVPLRSVHRFDGPWTCDSLCCQQVPTGLRPPGVPLLGLCGGHEHRASRRQIVVDVGSGTGRVGLEAALTADTRCLPQSRSLNSDGSSEKKRPIGDSATSTSSTASATLSPRPNTFADVVITSRASGWHLEEELMEFERVAAPGGYIVHCPGTAETADESEQHRCVPRLGLHRPEVLRREWEGVKVG